VLATYVRGMSMIVSLPPPPNRVQVQLTRLYYEPEELIPISTLFLYLDTLHIQFDGQVGGEIVDRLYDAAKGGGSFPLGIRPLCISLLATL